ncbi:hypothetical protein J7M02_07985 [Candidatus Aerophobetes bacterium]|nr:hypothetical protein [Candidatus Aerophobetes bacterium]
MKFVGIGICIVGSLIAILFVPCKFLGMSAGWHFIFSEAGEGMKVYQFIDTTALLLELILINGVGLALFFIGRKR